MRTTIPTIYTKNISLLHPLSRFRLCQGTRKLGSLVSTDAVLISNLLPQSMDSENRAHSHWLLIDQAQKIGVLQVVISDEDVCNWNSTPSNPHSLIPSTYCYYFHTLLIPSQVLAFSWKPVTLFDIHPKFSIPYIILPLYYLSPPICLEITPSWHII